jgi:hypothetical protein
MINGNDLQVEKPKLWDDWIFWSVFSAFLITYYWFFIRMVFFNSSQVMQVFDTVKRINPIGYDLVQMINYPTSWLKLGTTPYVGGNLYPPLTTVIFAPLINLDIRTTYIAITSLTLICFLGIAFLFPLGFLKKGSIPPTLILLFVCGLTSYGLMFELERGQFNVIAMALSFIAIYIFHRQPKFSWVAYILFTIAIQLKMYPAIFIVFFVRDWKDIKANLIRILGLGIANLALFFCLGWGIFQDFIGALRWKANDPGFWVGNISIRSFAQDWFPRTVLKFINIPSAGFDTGGKRIFEIALYLIVFFLLVIVLTKAIRKRKPEVDPFLLFTCSCAALLIPPVSHDFKLPILVGPAAYFLICMFKNKKEKSSKRWIITVGLIFLFSIAYFSTQYSYVQKSPLIANNFLAVFVMMVIVTVLSLADAGPNPQNYEKQK